MNNISKADSDLFARLFKENEIHIRKFIKMTIARRAPGFKKRVELILQNTKILLWQKMKIYNKSKDFKVWGFFWANTVIIREICNKPPAYNDKESLTADIEEKADTRQDPQNIYTAKEARSHQIRTIKELLTNICTHGGPHHHLLVFFFCKMISGWKPKKIVHTLSKHSLYDIFNSFIKHYSRRSILSLQDIDESFRFLRYMLDMQVKDVQNKKVSLEPFRHIAQKISGETTLQDYYCHHPTQNISTWVKRVKDKMYMYIIHQPDIN